MTRTIVAVIAVLVSFVALASADPFSEAYERGKQAAREGNLELAKSEFQRAYALRPEPLVLFNLAQVYRLDAKDETTSNPERAKANFEKALDYYRQYIEASTASVTLRSDAERFVTEIGGELKAIEDARAAAAAAAAAQGPKETDGTPVTIADPPVDRAPPVDSAPPVDPAPPPSTVERRRRIPMTSKVAVGVGGAGVIGGVVLGILGKRAESDLQSNPNATQSDADRVEQYELAINISWGVAAGGAIAAVAFYYATPSYTPVIAPGADGGWAASVMGRF